MMNIIKKYRVTIIVGACIEAILFIPAFIYAQYEGHAGMALVMILNIPFSFLGILIGEYFTQLTGNGLFSTTIALLITVLGQLILFSFLAYFIRKLFQKGK